MPFVSCPSGVDGPLDEQHRPGDSSIDLGERRSELECITPVSQDGRPDVRHRLGSTAAGKRRHRTRRTAALGKGGVSSQDRPPLDPQTTEGAPVARQASVLPDCAHQSGINPIMKNTVTWL
ncbi:hypothetical protein AAFF_G00147950 [Aldrovandia affinis]|uniref:Uncharacterized protein n=1 Tax=Aldrovandia affinis TaxID=143900 RepID=A0AAD7W9N5_9TELE|nr:hypothetical protein AAFF_G00147950 [Aldrovandia affinis]